MLSNSLDIQILYFYTGIESTFHFQVFHLLDYTQMGQEILFLVSIALSINILQNKKAIRTYISPRSHSKCVRTSPKRWQWIHSRAWNTFIFSLLRLLSIKYLFICISRSAKCKASRISMIKWASNRVLCRRWTFS